MGGYVDRAVQRRLGFKYYALAEGLSALLTCHPGPPATRMAPKADRQMLLFTLGYG